jgi:uncharacterized membrane protein
MSPSPPAPKRSLFAVLAAGLLASIPLLLNGPIPNAHDAVPHQLWFRHFSAQFWSGELYPRWLIGMNHGLGSPVFFSYPPVPYLIPTLLVPLAGERMAFVLGITLAYLLSGVFAWMWLRGFVGERAAALGAIFYLWLPYHLWSDLYLRCGVLESWALAWMPLALFFVQAIVRKKRWAFAGLAAAYGALIACHVFSALLFSPVLLAYGLILTAGRERLRLVRATAAAMTLGGILSAAYLIPALQQEQYVRATRQLAPDGYATHFLVTNGSLFHPGAPTPTAWYMTFVAANAAAIALLAFVAARRSRQSAWWGGVSAASVLMMLPWSQPVWTVFSFLQSIQFPWRFNTLLSIGAAALLALAIDNVQRPLRAARVVPLALCVLAMAPWAPWMVRFFQFSYRAQLLPELRAEYEAEADSIRAVYALWTRPERLTAKGVVAISTTPRAALEGGEAVALRWEPRSLAFRVRSASGGWLRVRQFYYPEWKARWPVRPSPGDGLIEVRVPAGEQRVELELPRLPAETAGLLLSALAFCGALGSLWWNPRHYRT